MNSFSGFQIIAVNGLQNGEGIAPPNIVANLTTYSSFAPVANYSNIYTTVTANVLPFDLTSANANVLINMGANSFPHVFGVVPEEFSTNIGNGPLFIITPQRTSSWFGTDNSTTVYLQVLGQAQSYAATAQAVIGSAASAQWVGGPEGSATGGFSAIGGNNSVQFSAVANAITGLGTLMTPYEPFNGFSNADCFNRILQSGNNTLGNLHLTFFGQSIVDPATGNTWVIGKELFDYVLNNPVGLTSEDTFQIAALNPLDAIIGQAADVALTQTGDLDAVITFFGISPNLASSVYQWTDCFNIPLLFGAAITNIISSSLNIGNVSLSPYYFIKGLVSNINGLTNLSSMTALGMAMMQIVPLSNANILLSQTTPISQATFANIQASFGPGSGVYGNPTVDDILGSTNFNQALTDTITGLKPLVASSIYTNISSDTSNIVNALNSNIFPVTLSDGSTYYDLNNLAIGGTTLVNQNASNLANLAASVTTTSLFASYNGIAETHNNSVTLSANTSPFSPINTPGITSGQLQDFYQVSGIVGLVLGIIHTYYGASQIIKIDNPPQATMFQKVPGAPLSSPSAVLGAFPASLASMASLATQIPNADEITGLNNVSNCIDSTSLTGQALNAIVVETQNNQILLSSGLVSQSFAPNPINLTTPSTGSSVIGGGLIH